MDMMLCKGFFFLPVFELWCLFLSCFLQMIFSPYIDHFRLIGINTGTIIAGISTIDQLSQLDGFFFADIDFL
jgi:hypothetical protein